MSPNLEWPRALSLTARLTVLFAGVLMLVLAGFAWLVFRETQDRFHELDQALLQGKVQLVVEAARRSRTEADLRDWLTAGTRGHVGLYIQLLNRSGERSEHGDIRLPRDLLAELGSAQVDQEWRQAAHSLYARRFEVDLGGDRNQRVLVIAAVDTRPHTRFLDALAIKTLGYAGFAVLVGATLGWLASRGGLQPLMAMKARAERLDANTLDERMPIHNWPMEMLELAHSLNGLLDRLQRDFDRLSAFSSNLAHEMRTPIANLLTAAQVTLAQPRSTEAYRHTLETIAEELQDLARTIADMLFLAKTENMHALPSVEQVDLGVEARSLVDFYDAAARERDLVFEVVGTTTVSGNRLMIRRAISNLLSNAVRHAHPGSVISIAVGAADGVRHLAVTNDGTGIPAASRAALFDRFVRLSPNQARGEGEGLGLGLAITKAILRAHHGQVRIRSSTGTNTFVLEFHGAQARAR